MRALFIQTVFKKTLMCIIYITMYIKPVYNVILDTIL